MAGLGPAPKDPATRARRNKPATPERVVAFVPAGRQALPDDLLIEGEAWHPATVRWWDRWADSPLSVPWSAVEWSEFEATAVLHQEYMKKRTFTLASEIRLRMAKFGATPEDKARLRIVDADAEAKDDKRASKGSRERYSGLSVVSKPAGA